ncbi:unnamed protein product [Rotaria sp. Silwood1]|nr:unnamed protein product [Rotaria sp. Silwood1]CAF1607059.1 unnamed protein product [Rotaria sp. Silwood1]
MYFSSSEPEVRASREGFDIRPFVKQIDAAPAEWPVQINYLYLPYHVDNNDVQSITIEATPIFVFGSAFYRIDKMSSIDEDFRLITTSDLMSDLQRQSFILDNDAQRQIVQIVLKLLNNTNEEVQNQAVKCLSLLVYKIKEDQIRIICQTLCSNCTNVSTITKQLRYISNLGLKAVMESLIINGNGLDNKAHILKEIMNYFINDIRNEELETTTDLNIIIFMLTKTIKNKNIYWEFHQKLKEIILKLLYSNKKNTNALCNILSTIQTSIQHINSLDEAKFKKLIQRIAEKTGQQNETIFTIDELNKLENAFNLSIDNIKQMIETIEYMFLQSAYHLIKPQILENDLINEQNFDENKAKIFVEQWSINAKEIVERLKTSHIASYSLSDIHWTLDVGITQSSKSKVKRPIAIYEFQLKNEQTKQIENIQTEFNKDELYTFFEKLESIQSQLDALMT